MQALSPPLKIMTIIGSLDVGGTERHLCQVLPFLHSGEFEFTVITISRRGALASKLEKAGIEVTSPTFPRWMIKLRLLILISTFLWLSLLILKKRPDVVHTYLPTAYIIGGLCAVLFRIPIRIMSRRSLNLYQQKHPFLQRLELWLHKQMHLLLGNSAAIVDELKQEVGTANTKVEMILNGVDTSAFRNSMPRNLIRSELNISKHALVIICVANLIPYKGHSDLLKALHQIRPQLPNSWHLLCVGRDDGPLEQLRNQTIELGLESNVAWLGPRDDIPNLLCAADIGVLPSHQEGLSNFVLEGMAAGLPMIVTEVGGNPELVINERTGLLVPVRAPERLGSAVLSLATNSRHRSDMGAAGRKRQIEKFSLDTCVSSYRNVYRALQSDRTLSNSP